jgi:hypothetical protein
MRVRLAVEDGIRTVPDDVVDPVLGLPPALGAEAGARAGTTVAVAGVVVVRLPEGAPVLPPRRARRPSVAVAGLAVPVAATRGRRDRVADLVGRGRRGRGRRQAGNRRRPRSRVGDRPGGRRPYGDGPSLADAEGERRRHCEPEQNEKDSEPPAARRRTCGVPHDAPPRTTTSSSRGHGFRRSPECCREPASRG